ncbi:MAG: hypothetical protein RLZZ215_2269, partial [Pseudomonadota bacterium]
PTRKLLMKLFTKRLQRQSGVVYNDVYIQTNTRVHEPQSTRSTPTALEGEFVRKDEP